MHIKYNTVFLSDGNILIYDILISRSYDAYDIIMFIPVFGDKTMRQIIERYNLRVNINGVQIDTYHRYITSLCYILKLKLPLIVPFINDENLHILLSVKNINYEIDIINNNKINNELIENSNCYVSHEKCANDSLYDKYFIFTSYDHDDEDNIFYINWAFDIKLIEYYAMILLKNAKMICVNDKYMKNDFYTDIIQVKHPYDNIMFYDNIIKPNSFYFNNMAIIYDIFTCPTGNNLYMTGPHFNKSMRTKIGIDITKLTILINGSTVDYNMISDKIYSETALYELLLNKKNMPLNRSHVIVTLMYGGIYQNYKINYTQHLAYENKKIVTTLFKDENHLVDNWIDYYLRIGFDTFVLYNNNPTNTSHYDYLINKYKEKIIFVEWPYPYCFTEKIINAQNTQQNHAIYMFKNAKWMAMIDLDEYIVSSSDLFNDFHNNKNIAALSLKTNWYGCNYLTPFSTSLDLNNFVHKLTRKRKCAEEAYMHQKCIINPKNIILFNIHRPIYYSGQYVILHEKYARMNHYFILSTKKRSCDCSDYDAIKDETIFKYYQ